MRFTQKILQIGALASGALAQISGSPNAIFALSNNTEFAFLLEEYMALSNNFGANTGEVLRAASQIVPGDFESWYREFKYLADTIHHKAASINAGRFPVSAREAYFRSSSYYRAADFFLHANISDPRIYSLWDSALADFDKAIALLPLPATRYNLTATNFTVPIIFFEAQNSLLPYAGKGSSCNTKKPTVIVGSGYDGFQEALYHSIGRSILDRGWNFVTNEGPGQPTVRRQQNIGFIPEWWEPLTPVVDFLAKRSDVDMSRVALVGESFGGTLAPLAASREHRLSAVVAIDGLLSIFDTFVAQFPSKLLSLFNSGNKAEFDKVMLGLMNDNTTNTQLRWLIAQGTFAFNTTSPFEWLTRIEKFKLDGDVLGNITCPVFIGEGENDTSAPGQPAKMAAMLGDKATYNLFKTDLGAGEHCQLGAEAQLTQVSLDWLADVWDGIKVPRNITSDVY